MKTYVSAEITRWVSDDFPGFVECQFADCFGKTWVVIEKVPVLTTLDLRSGNRFPQPVLIECGVVGRRQTNAGREIVEITTETPWGVTATDGTTRFEMYAEQLQFDRDSN